MSATLQTSVLVGVSFNALHIEKGNLYLNQQSFERKVTKSVIDENNTYEDLEKSNLNKAFDSMFGDKNLVGKYPNSGNEFLVSDVIAYRYISQVLIIFPENITFDATTNTYQNGFSDFNSNQNLKNLFLLLENDFFKTTNKYIDYKTPEKDDYYYQFSGEYQLDENHGKVFVVDKIEINEFNPFREYEVETIESYSGAPVKNINSNVYIESDIQSLDTKDFNTSDGSMEWLGTVIGQTGFDFVVLVHKMNGNEFTQFGFNYENNVNHNTNQISFYIDQSNKVFEIGDRYAFVLYYDDAYQNDDLSNPIFELQLEFTE